MRVYKSPFSLRDKHVAAVFDNPGQFMTWLDDNAAFKRMINGTAFYSGAKYSDVQRGAIEGDKAAAERAAVLMRKVTAKAPATTKYSRKSSPFGRVSIGAYLSADPMPCRVRVKQPSNTAPISVVVSLNSLANVGNTLLEQRGVAIAAMVRKLSSKRPVNLYLSRFSKAGRAVSSCMLVKFPTAPMDSYRLAFLLSNQGFCRGAGFLYHMNVNMLTDSPKGSGGINFAGGFGYSQSRHCQFSTDLQTLLKTEVFYIPGSDPSNPDFAMMQRDPLAWVNDTCEALTKEPVQ